VPEPSEPYYTDADAVRTELGVDDVVLDDAAALQLIVKSETFVDEMLGVIPVDVDTGRKIVEDDVEGWQWAKLGEATVQMAVFLFRNPAWSLEQRYDSVGNEVSGSGPLGSPLPLVSAILNQSGLRRLTGRATGGRRRRFVSFFGATRHDGT
jgi:hypothetical protein